MTFVDTSGLYAAVVEVDRKHPVAAAALADILATERAVTHNYVVLESIALLQRRHGLDGARRVSEELAPVMEVVWVDESLHAASTAHLFAANRRGLSLVDCVSFEVMRRRRIDTAFAFDPHFVEQGFRVVPEVPTSG